MYLFILFIIIVFGTLTSDIWFKKDNTLPDKVIVYDSDGTAHITNSY